MDVLPCTIVLGLKALLKVGAVAAVTVSVAEAVPLEPWLEVSAPEVFAAAPTVVEVTSIETVQVDVAATEPPV